MNIPYETIGSYKFASPAFIYDEIPTTRPNKDSLPRRRTISIRVGENNEVLIASAVCSPRDNFSKKIGRTICAGRGEKLLKFEDFEGNQAILLEDEEELTSENFAEETQEFIFKSPLPIKHIDKIVKQHLSFKAGAGSEASS